MINYYNIRSFAKTSTKSVFCLLSYMANTEVFVDKHNHTYKKITVIIKIERDFLFLMKIGSKIKINI